MRRLLNRILDILLSSAPLFIMVMLAAATWWLVQVTPSGSFTDVERPPREDPDYIVNDFISERFDQSGERRSWLTGDEARRYPAARLVVIDRVKMMSTESNLQDQQKQPVLSTPGIEFFRTTATADQGHIINEGEFIELHNNAYVTRQPLRSQGTAEKIEFRGDELRILVNEELMVSDKPVDITQDGTRFLAKSMIYHNATSTLEMIGAVRGVVVPKPKK